MLEELVSELLAHHGVQVVLSNPSPSVVTILERTGVPDMMGREWIFVRVSGLRCVVLQLRCIEWIFVRVTICCAALRCTALRRIASCCIALRCDALHFVEMQHH